MNRKTILALALASAFGLSTFAAYADDEQKETEKPQLVAEGESDTGWPSPTPEVIAEDDSKKDSPLPQLIADGHQQPADEARLIAEDEDKKDTEKPQLVA